MRNQWRNYTGRAFSSRCEVPRRLSPAVTKLLILQGTLLDLELPFVNVTAVLITDTSDYSGPAVPQAPETFFLHPLPQRPTGEKHLDCHRAVFEVHVG